MPTNPLQGRLKRFLRTLRTALLSFGWALFSVQCPLEKDCEHVSERLEDFNAVQCTVKNKRSVLESLDLFVEGEMLDGDNK